VFTALVHQVYEMLISRLVQGTNKLFFGKKSKKLGKLAPTKETSIKTDRINRIKNLLKNFSIIYFCLN
jgi:hypothetical protein